MIFKVHKPRDGEFARAFNSNAIKNKLNDIQVNEPRTKHSYPDLTDSPAAENLTADAQKISAKFSFTDTDSPAKNDSKNSAWTQMGLSLKAAVLPVPGGGEETGTQNLY
jgi:hypothetical protein